MKDNGNLSTKKIGIFLAFFSFLLFFLVTCYKITDAALCFDETIEYWFSKIMIGKLPFGAAGGAENSVNMYQRVISTFQPPLYNILMFFWLKISDSELWIRFFGVLMGFIGNVAIYKSIERLGNRYVAAIAVMFSTCTYRLVYYWQECSEYCLMLGTLCWTIYFFIRFIEEQSTRNTIAFVFSAIVPIYSQYGAVFPVASLLVLAYIYVLYKKKTIVKTTVSYVCAFIFAAVPLILFFLIKQMKNQGLDGQHSREISFNGNIIIDMVKSFARVLNWNFGFPFGVSVICVCMMIVVLLLVFLLTKNDCLKLLVISNALTWFGYYFAVKLGVFAYGKFGNRYNLFFIPLWIITLFLCGIEIYKCEFPVEVNNKLLINTEQKLKIRNVCTVITIGFIICYMFINWEFAIKNHWKKEDIRAAVECWLDNDGPNLDTIVYYASDAGFKYYLTQQDDYDNQIEKNVIYMDWYRDRTIEEYTDFIYSIYGEQWPQKICIAGSHIRDDYETLISVFTSVGYERDNVFDSDAYVVCLTR